MPVTQRHAFDPSKPSPVCIPGARNRDGPHRLQRGLKPSVATVLDKDAV